MLTYAAFRGECPIYVWLFGLPMILGISWLLMTGNEASAVMPGVIGFVAVLSDYLLGILCLMARNLPTIAGRVKFTVVMFSVIAGPALLWGFRDHIHPSTWTGPDPYFYRGYLRYVGGIDLKTVELDRAYYVPNKSKMINAAKAYNKTQEKEGGDKTGAAELANFKATLVEAKGLSVRFRHNRRDINIDGIDTDYDHILLSLKGKVSVRHSNRISEGFSGVVHDDFRFSKLDFAALPNQTSYIVPFTSKGLGWSSEEVLENDSPDLSAPMAAGFASFVEHVGVR